jgi:putative Mn2+ efflux pump MntP
LSLLTILAIALALAMDAFAVALTAGIRLPAFGIFHTLRMAGAFGFFQFFMPVLGWLMGVKAQQYIEAYDHWLAFGLLGLVGGKMLKEAWENRGRNENECTYTDPTRGATLLMLGVATSLDAMAIGLSLALLNAPIWKPAIIIGLVCFCVTALGMHLGRLVCSVKWLSSLGNLGNKANCLGGVVLLAIGLGILKEHGVFHAFL